MDQGMAIRASPVEYEANRRQLRSPRMAGGGMTLLAEPRRADLQQLRAGRAVSFMAVEAVLHDRRVLPQERPAPFRVALVAGLVDRSRHQERGIGAAVRVVAARAGHASLPYRHVRRALKLRLAPGMAVEASLHRSPLGKRQVTVQGRGEPGGGQRRRGILMNLVARDTGQAAGLMGAALPEQPLPLPMALQAAVG